MWNLFEQPWTLLGVAVLILLAVLTVRSVWPEKQRRWQWLLPLGVAALGVGLDAAVATDLEKINGVVKAGIQAAEREDCPAIARLIAADYEDSYHKSKLALMNRCRTRLVPPAIEKVQKIASEVEIKSPEAMATLSLLLQFDKNSFWAQNYKPSALVVMRFYFHKQPDKTWLIRRAEVVEVDKMPVNWGVTRAEPVDGTPGARREPQAA